MNFPFFNQKAYTFVHSFLLPFAIKILCKQSRWVFKLRSILHIALCLSLLLPLPLLLTQLPHSDQVVIKRCGHKAAPSADTDLTNWHSALLAGRIQHFQHCRGSRRSWRSWRSWRRGRRRRRRRRGSCWSGRRVGVKVDLAYVVTRSDQAVENIKFHKELRALRPFEFCDHREGGGVAGELGNFDATIAGALAYCRCGGKFKL